MPSDLTIDLVADWELTSGPNDSHINDLNLTEVGGPLTYGANGVSLNGIGQYLTHPYASVLAINSQSWAVWAEIVATDLTFPIRAIISRQSHRVGGGGNVYETMFMGADAFGSPDELALEFDTIANSYLTYSDGNYNFGSLNFVFGGYNAGATSTFMALNGTADADSLSIPLPETEAAPFDELRIGWGYGYTLPDGLWTGTLRRVRVWIGDGALTAAQPANQTWLYNSGAGRTYAEILATATPPANVIGNSVVTFSDSNSSWVVLASDGTGYASLSALHAAGKAPFPYLDPGVYPSDLILDCQTVDDTASPGSGFFFAVNREDEGFADLANDAARDAVATPVFSGQTFTYPCWTKKETILLSNVWVRKTGPTDLLTVTAVV